MSEALHKGPADELAVTTPAAGYSSGEVIQLADGRAGYVDGLRALASGEVANLRTGQRVTLAKTASVVCLKGGRAYWDRSANTVTPLRALAGADYSIGVFAADAAAADATVDVFLGVDPVYTLDALRDPSDTVIVKTAGTPALAMGPGYAKMTFSATAEAQKVDLLSKHSVPVDVPFIVELELNIVDSGDAAAAAVDINVGIASATHASDCDTIAESMFVHVDGADTNGAVNINLESDDGTTEVAATDTTVDFAAGTPFFVQFDCRDLTDIQAYVNGVNVLPASVFKLNAATGPLKLLAHMEKGANDTEADVRILSLRIRTMDAE